MFITRRFKNMSKDKKKENSTNNRRTFKIPKEVEKLAKMSEKSFKKETKKVYDGMKLKKKEILEMYYEQIVEKLPFAINLIVKYGNREEVKQIQDNIFEKITDPGFVSYLKKHVKKGEIEFDELELLPNVISIILREASKVAEANKESEDAESVEFDLDDLIELSRLILEKKLKKMKKNEIDDAVAFDALSAIPSLKILEKSSYYHIMELFKVLYQHAKDKVIDFSKLMKILFKKDEKAISSVIVFALLERKEKIVNFNEGQKKLFNDITEYSFATMEEMDKDDIRAILSSYIAARKKDDEQGKDTNRRYYISSLPESDYPKITKVVTKMVENDEEMKKYF